MFIIFLFCVTSWWLVRVTLIVVFGFCLKFWKVVGTYERWLCLKTNAPDRLGLSEVVDTQTLHVTN